MANWASDVLRAAEALAAGVASLKAQQSGQLRIAASYTVAEYLLPPWLERFLIDRPSDSITLDVLKLDDGTIFEDDLSPVRGAVLNGISGRDAVTILHVRRRLRPVKVSPFNVLFKTPLSHRNARVTERERVGGGAGTGQEGRGQGGGVGPPGKLEEDGPVEALLA